MSDPTPKPTTEEWADKVLADRDAMVRAKAFEEAAEVQPMRTPGAWASRDYQAGYDTAMKDKVAAIRALAKEQADE